MPDRLRIPEGGVRVWRALHQPKACNRAWPVATCWLDLSLHLATLRWHVRRSPETPLAQMYHVSCLLVLILTAIGAWRTSGKGETPVVNHKSCLSDHQTP